MEDSAFKYEDRPAQGYVRDSATLRRERQMLRDARRLFQDWMLDMRIRGKPVYSEAFGW